MVGLAPRDSEERDLGVVVLSFIAASVGLAIGEPFKGRRDLQQGRVEKRPKTSNPVEVDPRSTPIALPSVRTLLRVESQLLALPEVGEQCIRCGSLLLRCACLRGSSCRLVVQRLQPS